LISRRAFEWQRGLVLTDDYVPYDLLIGREKAAHDPS